MEGKRDFPYPLVNEFNQTTLEVKMKKTVLRSQELSCPSCVAKIEKALKAVPGVSEAKVFFNTGRIEVQHDPAQAGPDLLVKTIQLVGYEAKVSTF